MSTWSKNDLDVADYKCSFHSGEKVQGYCKTCDVPVCIQCILSKCNGHTFNNINSAMRDKQDVVLRQVIQLEEGKLQLLENKLAEFDQSAKNNDVEADKNVDRIIHRAKALKHKIDMAVAKLSEGIEVGRKRNQTKLTAAKYPLQTCYRDMTSLVRDYKEALRGKPDLRVMAMEREIHQAIQTVDDKADTPVPKLTLPFLEWEESAEILNVIERMMGRLVYDDDAD